MADRYFNPFQAIDINVPVEFHEAFTQYSQTGGNAVIDLSPFPRMVDLWFLAVCVAARLDLEPVDLGKFETKKIIDGSIFGSDPWRVHTLMLLRSVGSAVALMFFISFWAALRSFMNCLWKPFRALM